MEAAPFESQREDNDSSTDSFQVSRSKHIQRSSLEDPKFQKLKETLVDWINSTLKREHIVVQSLEEDLYDGLVLHHLLSTLAGVHLPLEEITLSSEAQTQKLDAILREADARLGPRDQMKWNTSLIHKKDLLATIHLLVAMVRHFQPELDLPSNVKVEVVEMEVSRFKMKSQVQTEVLTEDCAENEDPLLELQDHEVSAVKKEVLHFVNVSLSTLGLQVSAVDQQFSDGVILLLLIGQLEGFFIPLCDFYLTPVNHAEMVHNVTLALALLTDVGQQTIRIDPQDIVSQDTTATLKILHGLFQRHRGGRGRGGGGGRAPGGPST